MADGVEDIVRAQAVMSGGLRARRRSDSRRSALLAAMVAAAVVVASLAWPSPAKALSGTPYQCDSVPKYYCTTVQFDWGPSQVQNVARYYEGQISGVVVEWQLWWMQDWECGTYPDCVWIRNYGQQAWQTNTAFVWWVINANPTMIQNALVNMKLRYHEHYYDMGCLCQVDRYFCSPQLDHYLWSVTSATIGTGSC